MTRKYSRWTVAIGTVATGVTLLSGCSGSSKKTPASSSSGSGASATSTSAGTSSASTSATGGATSPTAAAAYNAAFGATLNPSTKTGGILQLGATADCDSWDPGRTYYGWCWNMQRLMSRGLVGYSVVN